MCVSCLWLLLDDTQGFALRVQAVLIFHWHAERCMLLNFIWSINIFSTIGWALRDGLATVTRNPHQKVDA